MATHALAFVYGGADVGGALAADPRVRTVHLTGSEATFNALVWGGPPPAAAGGGGAAAPRAERRLAKPVTAELGCVTPVIVAPGAWSPSDLEYYAAEARAAGRSRVLNSSRCSSPPSAVR